MGYLKTIPIDELELPSSPEFKVRMRARATHGMIRLAQQAAVHAEPSYTDNEGRPLDRPRVVTRTEMGAYAQTLMLAMLVDWDLTDENDQPLPLTSENLDKLDPRDGQFLSEEVNKRSGLRGRITQEDFKTPSS